MNCKNFFQKKYTKYTLYIGLSDKDFKRQIISEKSAIDFISSLFDSVTIQKATGIYTHENGRKIEENTLIVTYIDFEGKYKILPAINKIKAAFNQETIACEITKTNSILV